MSDPAVEIKTINGLKTGVCITGEGPVVLALHGWGGGIHSFWPVAERLAEHGFRVHLLDLPGFGKSDLPPETWGVAEYMQFVLAYLDAVKLRSVALLGHSFGGRIGLMLAADHPDRVSKMVLAASAGLRTPPTLKRRTRNFVTGSLRKTLDVLGLVRWRKQFQKLYNQRYASEDYLTAGPLRESFVQIISQDLTSYAQRVHTPTVLIWGDQDSDTPLWQGKKLEQLIPDAGLIVFQGVGHFAYLERLGDYIRIVTHFLNAES
ncbi:MAG: alpha/beta hydrolase [Anaerolineae bacterium]|nr:alpha/beta hydrolase [Anaerolineae bacterium]